jgi:preprotein translocase subunit SecE
MGFRREFVLVELRSAWCRRGNGRLDMAKVTPGEFVRQVRAETAKVVWPSRREVVQTTILVLIMTTILAVFFLGVDQILGRSVKFLLTLGA